MGDEIRHTGIFGITGSGKTVYCRRWFSESDKRCLFINTTEDLKVSQTAEITVKKQEDVIKAFKSGYHKVCWNCGNNRDLTQIRDFMFNVGLEINKKDVYHIFDIFIDEAHDDWIALEDFSTRGRRHGCRLIFITQHPAVMTRKYENTVMTQMNNHVLFKLGTYSQPYLEKYRIPYQEHQDWLNKPYHFCEYDGVTMTRYVPVDVEA